MISYPDYLDKIQPYKPGKPIDEVRRELGLNEVIKLASNENPFGCSLFVKKAVEKHVTEINLYPDGGCYYLRKELSNFTGVDGENFIFGNGSNEIIDLIGRAFLTGGKEALAFEGSFIVYKLITTISGGLFKEVPLEKDYSRDLNKLLESITPKTSVIFLDNPCNPTGFANTKEEFEEFLKNVPNNVLVVLDEAYYEYGKGSGLPDGINYILGLNPEIKNKNLIVLRTFSKAYGLAGLRIGYGVSNKKIISILEKVRQPFNVNYLGQIAAVEALKDQKFVEFSVEQNEKGKLQIYEGLEVLGIRFFPTYGNFVMFEVKNPEFVYSELLKKGVVIRPAFGFKNGLRVSIGREDQNEIFLDSLRKILSKSPP
ncbi:histidinol-phosphate transaminase [Persephonella sp.]